MNKTLQLQTIMDDTPSALIVEGVGVMLSSYKHTAKRMGNAPSITGSIQFPICLDDYWDDLTFVEFRGERYFLKRKPKSSKDNSSLMFKHDVEFVSERTSLEHIYFQDVVLSSQSDGSSIAIADSSNFSFFGTIRDLRERLNRSLEWSGSEYRVAEISESIRNEEQKFLADDITIYDALVSAYDVYKIPFYFSGKNIYFDYCENEIPDVVGYGASGGLISVVKDNTTTNKINRIFGYGSNKNIPYYYPNPTPKGTLGIEQASKGKYEIENQKLFSSSVSLDKTLKYTAGYTVFEDTIKFSNNGKDFSEAPDDGVPVSAPETMWVRTTMQVVRPGYVYTDILFDVIGYNTQHLSYFFREAELTQGTVSLVDPYYREGIEGLFCGDLKEGVYTLTVKVVFSHIGTSKYNVKASARCVVNNSWRYLLDSDTDAATGDEVNITKSGLKLTSGAPEYGDTIKQVSVKFVNTQDALMPSIYRLTNGRDKSYDAINNKYEDINGEKISFSEEYSVIRPKEDIVEFNDIYPTITGVKNNEGLRIDRFVEIAFDTNDNDETIEEDGELKYVHPYFFVKLRKMDFNLFDHAIENGDMIISPTTGKCGGCEFKIGVDNAESRYNTVQTRELINSNTGEVYIVLKRDKNGDVVCGREGQGGQTPQEWQNDTINNEVWIALKKDIDTYGVIMPNAASSMRPSIGDEFVIINIDMPETYVTSAEKRLDDAMIGHMADNNSDKFGYSIKLSRVFISSYEHSNLINENAKLTLNYNGRKKNLFVSAMTTTVNADCALPEISIELRDDIKLYSGFSDRIGSKVLDKTNKIVTSFTVELDKKYDVVTRVAKSNTEIANDAVAEANKVSATIAAIAPTKADLDPSGKVLLDQIPSGITADYAVDITGVIEATPEEFVYRPSAGNRSIRDASAVIRRIKGNSFVWHQYALELSVNNYTIRGDVVTQSDNSLHITSLNPDNKIFIQALKSISFGGHKWLSIADVKSDEELTIKGMSSVGWTPNERCLVSSFYTSSYNNEWYWGVSYKTNVPSYVDIYSFSIYDLTLMFGAGNEPTNIEEFKSSFPDSYYPYSEPEVRNVITNQITTIGFNQWDEQWELGALATNTGGPVANHERGRSVNFFDVIPNATYYCATIAPTTTNSSGIVGSMIVWWYDNTRTMIKYEDITNKTRVAPSNARYAKICSYGGDVNAIFNGGVNINLSHSGVRDGEYEPYERNIRTLPEIYKYFPDGMNGNANVWDEINAESAIKRWEVVDLGTLTWSARGTNISGEYRWDASGISTPPTAKVSTIPNIICAKYATGSNDDTYARRDCVTISASGNIRIFDSQYKETSSKESFVASLQGVLLYYELAEPKITPITEAIQLDYVVDDFGTEKASAFGNSAPFRADIVYQFNAEGRIRDNSRNIERVENTITTRLIPSQTAMLGLPNKVMTWNGRSTMMSLPIAESIDGWELEESPLGVLPTGKQVKDYISSITNRLIPSQSAMLGLPNKVMIWNGSTAMMSLPIAEDIDHWDLEESKLGTIPTSQQVREYIKSITDNLTPSQSATLESSNRVMVWNGNYAMTSLPIAANFTEWAEGAIPTGQQVMDYISAIKVSLATGLMPKETLTIGASGSPRILPNKAYEITTASNTNYNVVLKIETIEGVDAAADNEWRIRIDTRNGFSGSIVFNPLAGYLMCWAYSDVSGPLTAPNIKDGHIWDIQFRMIGRTLLGSYKKY